MHSRYVSLIRRVSVGMLAPLTIMLMVLTGCDRTRPMPGSEAPSATVSTPAPAPAPAAGAGATTTAKGPQVAANGVTFSYSGAGASSVHLAGSFNDWSTSSDPLTKGANGVWTLVKKLDPGTYPYKFVINGTEWKEDPANPEKADDGYGGSNSQITVP